MKLSSGAVLLAIALLAGYQSTPEVPPSVSLADYTQLTPAPDREGDKRLLQGGGDYLTVAAGRQRLLGDEFPHAAG